MISYKKIIVVISLLLLGACASGAQTNNMIASRAQVEFFNLSPKLEKSVVIQEVSGGKETNPLWMSNVGTKEFEAALTQSLIEYGIFSMDNVGRYKIKATLQSVDRPTIGLDMTTTTIVQYDVIDSKTDKPIFVEQISEQGTATMGEAFLGVERLRMSIEKSVQNNIRTFINKLNSKVR